MINRDAYDDFVEYDKRQEAELKMRPVCDYCGEHIQDDWCYEIGNEIICKDCLESNFSRDTEDFIY